MCSLMSVAGEMGPRDPGVRERTVFLEGAAGDMASPRIASFRSGKNF